MTNSTTTIKQITDLFNQAYYESVVNKLLATPGLHNITVVIGNNCITSISYCLQSYRKAFFE